MRSEPSRILHYYARITAVSASLALLTAILALGLPRPGDVTVLTAVPTGNASVDTVICSTFSRDVDRTYAEKSFVLVPPVTGSFSWKGTTMCFKPDGPLQPDAIYRVIIGRDLRDVRGRPNESRTEWSFRTRTADPG